MRIIIPETSMAKCKSFAIEVEKYTVSTEFRQSDNSPRSRNEKIKDTLMGKLGEEAFAIFLKQKYNIDVDLDFNIYKTKEKGDDQDVELNGFRIEIKSTRSRSKWLLVDFSNLISKEKIDKLPHVYVLCIVGWDKENDTPLNHVDIVGYAPHTRFKSGYKNTRIISKGQCLPNTNCRLQASNYGIHIDNLRKDFEYLIDSLLKVKKL